MFHVEKEDKYLDKLISWWQIEKYPPRDQPFTIFNENYPLQKKIVFPRTPKPWTTEGLLGPQNMGHHNITPKNEGNVGSYGSIYYLVRCELV